MSALLLVLKIEAALCALFGLWGHSWGLILAGGLERAGVESFPMHELRHSAGTNFWRETRDLRLTQRLMRHKSIRTTADTYLHDDAADLAEAFDGLAPWTVED